MSTNAKKNNKDSNFQLTQNQAATLKMILKSSRNQMQHLCLDRYLWPPYWSSQDPECFLLIMCLTFCIQKTQNCTSMDSQQYCVKLSR